MPNHDSTRASIWFTVIGILLSLLGGILILAGQFGQTQNPAGPGPQILGLGLLMAVFGVPSFIIGILVEFFSISTHLAAIHSALQTKSSLPDTKNIHQPLTPATSDPRAAIGDDRGPKPP